MLNFKTQMLIIGSGPAGCTAAIYGARAGLNPIMIHGIQPGGQLTITTDVENYPGFADPVSGPWLMEQMIKQSENVGTKVVQDTIISVNFDKRPFEINGESNIYEADTVVICTGAQAKWLGLPSEEHFKGFGVSGCATCDGVFYRNKKVLVVGGGNTAVEEALYLTKHASKVILIHRRDNLRAEKILQSRLFRNPKVEIMWYHVLHEVAGNNDPRFVTGVKLMNLNTSAISDVSIDGVFIAIGHKPNTSLFKDYLDLDEEGYIITQSGSTATNITGVFAAGDVQDKKFRQAITAAGTGCMAAMEIEKLLT